ncbi:MAG: hypothetical protein A2Y13_11690 [Planctomycetes bacterium GWC2_45_44]|nr:MAG: hypothetical protein A2Y13_11690 [Planctomycetes bacterium GWC2_45_44]HBR18927.1 hypothetical protein [Phycisphaerales bacterium]
MCLLPLCPFSKLLNFVSKLTKTRQKQQKNCEICVKTFNFLTKFYKICKKLAHLAENLRKRIIVTPYFTFQRPTKIKDLSSRAQAQLAHLTDN